MARPRTPGSQLLDTVIQSRVPAWAAKRYAEIVTKRGLSTSVAIRVHILETIGSSDKPKKGR
jgi:hypothetical protein